MAGFSPEGPSHWSVYHRTDTDDSYGELLGGLKALMGFEV